MRAISKGSGYCRWSLSFPSSCPHTIVDVLWRAVQSVLAQSEVRWELLIINDGSADDTLRMLEEFRDPRIRTFTTANQGASAARNFAASHVSAPYLAYIDSDNTWHPDFLATMLHAIQRQADGVLWYCRQHTSIWQRAANGEWTLERLQLDSWAQYGIAEVLQLQGADTNCIVHTRHLLEAIGGWDEACSFLEDWDLFARCMLRYPTQAHWVPRVLVEYRQVYGVAVDGLCATTVQDPIRKRGQWQYLVDKWHRQPGFETTAQRLTAKYLLEA
jgi:hypothetical protein